MINIKNIHNEDKMNLYMIYDKVSKNYLYGYSGFAHTPGEYMRNIANFLIDKYSLRDLECREVSVRFSTYSLCSWKDFQRPDTLKGNLSMLGYSEQEIENSFNKEKSDFINETENKTEEGENVEENGD